MNYLSTRGGVEPVGFSDAVMMGQARDGGLLIPETIPHVGDHIDTWSALDYTGLSLEIMKLFVDIASPDVEGLVQRSYEAFDEAEVTPLRQVGPLSILELFHGPTLAFKDLALQFLGNLFSHLLAERGGELNILTATSGDTGSAAIQGIRGREHIRVFVMHPRGRISRSQELQMTSVLDENVHNLAIEGTFDDCQRIMKAIFGDLEFRDRCRLGSANSINWARVLAQIVYYAYATLRIIRETGAPAVRIAVPTGNFGNIFAGYVCGRMGFPIRKLILATNENDILARFFNTGEYRSSDVQATISPAMDIQVASNFERYLYYHVGEDGSRVRTLMKQFSQEGKLHLDLSKMKNPVIASGSGNTEATLSTIKRYYEEYGYLLDPHTAVGVSVAERHVVDNEPMVCLATAHPAKFGDAIEQAIGQDIAHHPVLDSLVDQETRVTVLPASVDAVRDYLVSRI
jgi:threonine synthase